MARSIDFQSILAKLRHFYRDAKRAPTFSEMKTLFGYRSKGGVSVLIPHLVQRGIFRKDAGGRLSPGKLLEGKIRLLGSVQAGFPSPAEEELTDTLSLDEFLIRKPAASYLVKVTGDSMTGAGIFPGDLVIVERGREAAHGDIVVAQVDGQWTMKFFEKHKGQVVLRAANPKYPLIRPQNELVIGGVVVANVRKYH